MKKNSKSGNYRNRIVFISLVPIIFLILTFSVIVGYIGYNGVTDAMMTQYEEGAFQAAEAASIFVDPNRISEYMNSEGKTVAYQSVWGRLDQLCQTTGMTFVYVILPDLTDYAHITFLFSTMNHNSNYHVYDFGYVRETTNDEYRQKYRALFERTSEREIVVRDQGYIETDPHITAMVPLVAADGETKAILCVQRQMSVLAKARNTYMNKLIIALVLLVLILIIGESMHLHYLLLMPVKKITQEASRFADENVAARQKLGDVIANRDEIGILAKSIDQMEEQINSYMENLTRITAERERIRTELSLASRIQADMLPNVFPAFPDRPEFDIYASMDPAREVGGDFYDFFLIDPDHLCVIIADVSGKGIPAALYMMATKIIVGNSARIGIPPAGILESANEAICSNNREEMFITVWLGILEISTGKVRAVNAGHEYPSVRHAGGRFEILKDKHGFVLGGMEGMKYQEYEILLEPGSKLFLMTDGVPEATDAEENMFGMERMVSALNEDPDADPQGILRNVRRALDGFVKDAEQFDDLTMICLEYKGKN